MKAGDLVTLSAYGLKSSAMWNWKRQANEGKPVIGIVVRVTENPYTYSWTSKNEKMRYHIEWCGEGPVSRDRGASNVHLSPAMKQLSYFLRNDLRFIR